MYLGAQLPYDDDLFRFAKQMGVEGIDTSPAEDLGVQELGYWQADRLCQVRERVESHGLRLEAMHLPLTSAGIHKQAWPSIMLGTAERDRDIDHCCKCIEAAAQAGIPLLLYNLAILPVVRTPERSPGRGGVTYSHFDYESLKNDPPLDVAPLTIDQAWERITYFVERVIPVAEANGVRLGCHQHDPGMPGGAPYRGIHRVLGSLEGVKRFVALSDSPYHGLNFCQGTISEICTSADQVYEAIRYFGQRKRIFWVHFRNIRGGMGAFDEVFPDEGDIDMLHALRTYDEIGYKGAIIPDHVPHSELDSRWGHQARAFCLGYIRAMIQTIQREPR